MTLLACVQISGYILTILISQCFRNLYSFMGKNVLHVYSRLCCTHFIIEST